MVSKQVIKLFAVVVLVGGCDQGVPAQKQKPQANSGLQAPQVQLAVTRVPRTLADGRPASGNVARRPDPMPRPSLTDRRAHRRGR
jgi:hypothetical protein